MAYQDNETSPGQGSVETVAKDIGTKPSDEVRRWKMEIAAAKDRDKHWIKEGERVERKYRGIRGEGTGDGGKGQSEFNILWANTETLTPAIYSNTPKPDVRRRFRDVDEMGKQVSEVLERALSFSVDSYDFDAEMEAAVQDYLLPGRGQVRVRYEAYTDEADGLLYEEATCELVPWDKFILGPGRRWQDVPWIGFEHELTRNELVDKFGPIGRKIPLDETDNENKDDKDAQDRDILKKGLVYEIWNKRKREVIYIAPKYTVKPIKKEKDPLELQDFFPVPRPLVSIATNKSTVPIPEFTIYESQAEELDIITARIRRVTKAIRARGIYASDLGSDIANLLDADEPEMVPAENISELLDKGGLDKALMFVPIESLANVLQIITEQREILKNQIYELTGIADILRGVSDPREKATTQSIKAQWGAQRLQRRQREVQRFVRDVLRLKAEIIAEHFDPQTLELMTGQQIAPEAIEMMQRDTVREYRIDVETDSTVAADLEADKASITELLTAIGMYIEKMMIAVQSGAMPQEAAMEMLLVAVRKHKMGREVEDILEDAKQRLLQSQKEAEGQPPEPSPEELDMQMKQQEMQQNAQLKQAEIQQRGQSDQMRLDFEREKMQTEISSQRELKELEMASNRDLKEREFAINGENRDIERKDKDYERKLEGKIPLSQEKEMEELTNAIKQMLEVMIQNNQAIMQSNAQLVQVIAAPKELVRDEQGRVVGSRPSIQGALN